MSWAATWPNNEKKDASLSEGGVLFIYLLDLDFSSRYSANNKE